MRAPHPLRTRAGPCATCASGGRRCPGRNSVSDQGVCAGGEASGCSGMSCSWRPPRSTAGYRLLHPEASSQGLHLAGTRDALRVKMFQRPQLR